MDMVVLILLVAAIAEAIIECVEMVVAAPTEWKPYAGFILGGGGAYLFGLDVMVYLGVAPVSDNAAAILNPVLIGFLIMRHSGNINKIWEFLKYLKGLGGQAENWSADDIG